MTYSKIDQFHLKHPVDFSCVPSSVIFFSDQTPYLFLPARKKVYIHEKTILKKLILNIALAWNIEEQRFVMILHQLNNHSCIFAEIFQTDNSHYIWGVFRIRIIAEFIGKYQTSWNKQKCKQMWVFFRQIEKKIFKLNNYLPAAWSARTRCRSNAFNMDPLKFGKKFTKYYLN